LHYILFSFMYTFIITKITQMKTLKIHFYPNKFLYKCNRYKITKILLTLHFSFPHKGLLFSHRLKHPRLYYLSMALQSCYWTLAAFSVSETYKQSVGLLGGGSVRCKATTYTKNNRNTE
jgi:hypothetical protein